ncbi:ADP-ribosylation factor-binding protein GGA2 [Cyberlindnera fabianii]|uniref:ADP-ribosylation factor-binding protein GGA2 n=1 Tax=Cyberlindnera fabianii TaxID=36022 RepID=A0A1V2L2I8_CYBFA|nr:ADP-ribosylation factor-binding protein GGA2 [Cyberlindnera fabianii]
MSSYADNSLAEPDLSLNLAVADYVNAKQGSTPREAAVTIVSLINSKDSHTAVFAIALLDVLVKNCGYPFHLQISRKEFLNELVKRFPERPPMRYSRVQRLILGAIEEWNQTICKTSRHKDDLGFIRDMHRLLSYKGYSFPEVKPEDASVLNPSDNLKSIEEIQKEEQIAHAAKLQELVRRGRPSDLKEANKLMKIMAGFKDDTLVESKAKVAEDLDRLKRKADIFAEMLSAAERQGSIDTTDETIVELYSAVKVSQPKIQKIISEESDDEEAVQDLLKLNDTLNGLIQKYNLLKGGDIAGASNVQVASTGSGALESLSLIDFGDDTPASPTTQAAGSSSNNVDDLLGDLGSLSFNNSGANYGAGGDIALGGSLGGSPAPQQPPASTGPNYDVFSSLMNPSSSKSTPAPSTTTTSTTMDLLGDFGSPAPSTPQTNTTRALVNESNNLKFEVALVRESPNTVRAQAFFSNRTASSITGLAFLVAVPKSLQLRLEAQSGSFIPAFGNDAVTQVFRLDGATTGVPLKIKWKINYNVNGSPVEETATYVFPTI